MDMYTQVWIAWQFGWMGVCVFEEEKENVENQCLENEWLDGQMNRRKIACQ